MIINATNYGIEIIVPETKNNMEFSYPVRLVKVLNSSLYAVEKNLIDELSEREKPLLNRLKLLIFSMENFFKSMADDGSSFDTFEKHNKLDFNDWYHSQARSLVEEIENCSIEFTERSRHGWCF